MLCHGEGSDPHLEPALSLESLHSHEAHEPHDDHDDGPILCGHVPPPSHPCETDCGDCVDMDLPSLVAVLGFGYDQDLLDCPDKLATTDSAHISDKSQVPSTLWARSGSDPPGFFDPLKRLGRLLV